MINQAAIPEVVGVQAAAPELLKALQFVFNDLNSHLDYEALLIVQAALYRAIGDKYVTAA